MTTNNQFTAGPLDRLRHHVTGAIERGEKTAIVGQPHKPDSRLPWRVVRTDDCFEVWTRQDNTPGSRNNYMIAGGIQNEAEAIQLAASPELLEALRSITESYDKLLEAYGKPHGWGTIESDNARAAIQKATGGTQ